MHIWSAISVVLAYLVAQFAVAWALASNSVSSDLNGVKTYRQWFVQHAAGQVVQMLTGFAAMFIYAEYSTPICNLVAQHFSSLSFLAKDPIPLIWPIAMAWGLFANPILHIVFGILARKWPVFGFLSPELPPPPPPAEK